MIVLDKQIWPDGFFDVVCPGGFVPEFWVIEDQKSKQSVEEHCIVGFIAGKKAESLSRVSEASIVSKSLAQLDEIFGEISLPFFSPSPSPSSS